MSAWPCLQMLVIKKKFEIVFEIIGSAKKLTRSGLNGVSERDV